MLIIAYKNCSTCQKVLRFLNEQGFAYTFRDIKTQRPSVEELQEFVAKSGLPLKKLFNTSGKLYKQFNLKDKLPTMSEKEIYELLASDGLLLKRPLLILEHKVLVGFKETEWLAAIRKEIHEISN